MGSNAARQLVGAVVRVTVPLCATSWATVLMETRCAEVLGGAQRSIDDPPLATRPNVRPKSTGVDVSQGPSWFVNVIGASIVQTLRFDWSPNCVKSNT